MFCHRSGIRRARAAEAPRRRARPRADPVRGGVSLRPDVVLIRESRTVIKKLFHNPSRRRAGRRARIRFVALRLAQGSRPRACRGAPPLRCSPLHRVVVAPRGCRPGAPAGSVRGYKTASKDQAPISDECPILEWSSPWTVDDRALTGHYGRHSQRSASGRIAPPCFPLCAPVPYSNR